jgi:hypothetical protein
MTTYTASTIPAAWFTKPTRVTVTGRVVFRDSEGAVVLAEDNANVRELAQVGTLGSATRGVRPEVRS